MLGDVALHEDRGPLGIDAGRHEHLRRLQGRGGKLGGLPRQRQRVQIDDAVEGVVLVLELDPVPQGTHVVAEVDVTRRLDPREHSRHPPRVRVAGQTPR